MLIRLVGLTLLLVTLGTGARGLTIFPLGLTITCLVIETFLGGWIKFCGILAKLSGCIIALGAGARTINDFLKVSCGPDLLGCTPVTLTVNDLGAELSPVVGGKCF